MGFRTLREQRKGGVIPCLTWKLLSDLHCPQNWWGQWSNHWELHSLLKIEPAPMDVTTWAPSPGHLVPISVPRPRRLPGHLHILPSQCEARCGAARLQDNEPVLRGGVTRQPARAGRGFAKSLNDLFTVTWETGDFSEPDSISQPRVGTQPLPPG